MLRQWPIRLLAAFVVVPLIAACDSSASKADAPTASPTSAPVSNGPVALIPPSTQDAARQYCIASGGSPHVAHAFFNTNAARAKWLALAGTAELCPVEKGKPGASSTTRIYVDLDTLYSRKPTLAGVAYLSKIRRPGAGPPSASPATKNCTALEASS